MTLNEADDSDASVVIIAASQHLSLVRAMDALRAAIASRRSALANSAKRTGDASDAGDAAAGVKKYKTNHEIQHEKRALATRSSLSSTITGHAASPVSGAETESKRTAERKAAAANDGSDETTRPSAFEVKKRLRSLGEPIQFFGESELERWQRLRSLELLRVARGVDDESQRSGADKKGRNIFHDILTTQVETEINHAILQQIEATQPASASNTGDSSASASHDGEMQHASKKKSYANVLLKRADVDSDEDYVLYFIRRCLSEWESALDSRTVAVKVSLSGRMESAKQKQTREYLKPFLLLLKSRQCERELLADIFTLCQLAAMGQYEKSNEAYLKIAIGNSPWPMGVTMVSIHERSGRQRIQGDQVAHVLNDETQRKYISSLKRLVSWCEQQYPRGWDNV